MKNTDLGVWALPDADWELEELEEETAIGPREIAAIRKRIFRDDPGKLALLEARANPSANAFSGSRRPYGKVKEGDIWMDPSTDTVHRFDGMSWIEIGHR